MEFRKELFGHLRAATRSDIGRRRKNNEDSHGEFPALGVWCVADGMGGGDDGEVASAAVVKALDAAFAALPDCAPGAYAAGDVSKEVSRALDGASAWIFDRTRRKGLKGCGSTFVGVAFDPTEPGTALALHVGDSRLYRLRGRDLKQITKDHSVAEMMGAKDEKDLNPMFRGMILRAVGIEKTVDVETTPFAVREGDVVLVCSDGLTRMVSNADIARIVRDSGDDSEMAVTRLIEAANAAGGIDNVTATLVYVGSLPNAVAGVEMPHGDEGRFSGSSSGACGTTRTTAPSDDPSDIPAAAPRARKRGVWFALGGAAALVVAALGFLFWSHRPAAPSRADGPVPARARTVSAFASGTGSSAPTQSVAAAEAARRESNDVLQVEAALREAVGTNVPPHAAEREAPAANAVAAAPVPAEPRAASVAGPSTNAVAAAVTNASSFAALGGAVATNAPARADSKTAADSEREAMAAELKAERERREREEAKAAERDRARQEVAQALAAEYNRDAFSDFAIFVNRALGRGTSSEMQRLAKTLSQCRKDADATEHASALAKEILALSERLERVLSARRGAKRKKAVAEILATVAALKGADPVDPATQRACLKLMETVSAEVKGAHGRR